MPGCFLIRSRINVGQVFLLSLNIILSSCQHAPTPTVTSSTTSIAADSHFGAMSPISASQPVDVILIPQWHLSSQANTNSASQTAPDSDVTPLLPQAENQLAIYHQLAQWIDNAQIKTVIVEGCKGEINKDFREQFNGWSLSNLEKLDSAHLDSVMTQIGLKLKARYGEKLKVLCGDDPELVTKHQLILSDLRGLTGFKLRIMQFKNDPKKYTSYIESVRELLKLNSNANDTEVENNLDLKMRELLDEFKQVLIARDESFVQAIKGTGHPGAVVIGALHIEDLKARLAAQNESVQLFQPKGLKGDESTVIEQFELLLQKIPKKKEP